METCKKVIYFRLQKKRKKLTPKTFSSVLKFCLETILTTLAKIYCTVAVLTRRGRHILIILLICRGQPDQINHNKGSAFNSRGILSNIGPSAISLRDSTIRNCILILTTVSRRLQCNPTVNCS